MSCAKTENARNPVSRTAPAILEQRFIKDPLVEMKVSK
jgi:hypothetical protein